MTHYLEATYHTWQSREPYPDGWDNGDIDGSFDGVRVCDRLAFDAVETELTGIVYAVYVTYYTGSTFGQDYRAKVLEVFDEEWKASEFRSIAMGTGTAKNPWSFEYDGKSYHRDWIGYFESLIDLDYETVVI